LGLYHFYQGTPRDLKGRGFLMKPAQNLAQAGDPKETENTSFAPAEDRGTLGSDPSADLEPCNPETTGRGLTTRPHEFEGGNFMREICVIRGDITREHVRLRKL
jgi:hypothetical protein